MLALLASAHLMQAAGKSFTATIKSSANLADYPGLKMSIFTGGGSSIPINNSGTTQVTLIDGTEYNTLMASANTVIASQDNTLLYYPFRADIKTPIIAIDGKNLGGGTILIVSFKKS